MPLASVSSSTTGRHPRGTDDPSDGRAVLVRAIPRGLATVDVARAAIEEVRAEWQAYLGERDLAALDRILGRLREITNPYQ
jgi:DNA-binding MarR family transcriptional regulator